MMPDCPTWEGNLLHHAIVDVNESEVQYFTSAFSDLNHVQCDRAKNILSHNPNDIARL